jgi:4-diphosphocytidyl-2-C-methyl-D-erythritol kinase
MVTFPNGKINIGLRVLQKREDGFHNIETVFFPVPVTDILEIVSSPDASVILNNTGTSAGNKDDNLCLKAYYLLKKDFPRLPEVKIHLHKMIPAGAGLGGGSADASFTLSLLNEKYGLDISKDDLFSYALQLGSDCPFFVLNRPCFATGRGEILEKIRLSLASFQMLLVNPEIHVNTGEAFRKISPSRPVKSIKDIIQQPIASWKTELINDFEEPVFFKHPQIKEIRDTMYRYGAEYAAMTGTGSTVFGLFKVKEEILFPAGKEYFYKWIERGGLEKKWSP